MDGQLDRSGMDALQNIVGGNTQGFISNGTYEFDEPTMRNLITKWLELAESYDRSFRNTVVLVTVEGPGLDFASQAHAEAANASGRAYRDYLQHNRDYCYEQAQLYQDALHDYLGIEHANVTEIAAAGEPVDDGPQAGI
jgi:hypothetical protein